MTELTIKEHLELEVKSWERVGHPALLQRFVLRNGKVMQPAQSWPEGVTEGELKMCFKNAYEIALEHGYDYYEGYGMGERTHGFLVHHAWCMDDDGKVIDTTWPHFRTAQYIGVFISIEELLEQTDKTGVYGVLGGEMINHEFLFERDPELRNIAGQVNPRVRRLRNP